MYITLKDKKISVLNITGQTMYKDNLPRESITFSLDFSKYTFEEVNNIFSNMPSEFMILGDDDKVQGVHKGFIYLDKIEMKMSTGGIKNFEITVYSTTNAEQKIFDHDIELKELKQINESTIKELANTKIENMQMKAINQQAIGELANTKLRIMQLENKINGGK